MTLEEFGQNVSPSGVLTPEESILFYEKLCGVERKAEMWNMTKRGGKLEELLRCCRFGASDHRIIWNSVRGLKTRKNSLCISFSRPVKLHGVRLLGDAGEDYDVKVEVLSQVVEERIHLQQNSRPICGFDVSLAEPILVEANVFVHIKVTIEGYRRTYIGSGGENTTETNGIFVNFINLNSLSPGLNNNPVEEDDLIDEIIFSENN